MFGPRSYCVLDNADTLYARYCITKTTYRCKNLLSTSKWKWALSVPRRTSRFHWWSKYSFIFIYFCFLRISFWNICSRNSNNVRSKKSPYPQTMPTPCCAFDGPSLLQNRLLTSPWKRALSVPGAICQITMAVAGKVIWMHFPHLLIMDRQPVSLKILIFPQVCATGIFATKITLYWTPK